MTSDPKQYRYAGAAALVQLHETHLREFLTTWREVKAVDLRLPETDDPAYASLAELLRHVLGCARHYLEWCAKKLDLPDPGVDPTPEADQIESRAEQYVEHVLKRWRHPLADVSEQDMNVVHESAWGVGYCIDAMLEHAVMHPIRHTFQLRTLMRQQERKGSR